MRNDSYPTEENPMVSFTEVDAWANQGGPLTEGIKLWAKGSRLTGDCGQEKGVTVFSDTVGGGWNLVRTICYKSLIWEYLGFSGKHVEKDYLEDFYVQKVVVLRWVGLGEKAMSLAQRLEEIPEMLFSEKHA